MELVFISLLAALFLGGENSHTTTILRREINHAGKNLHPRYSDNLCVELLR